MKKILLLAGSLIYFGCTSENREKNTTESPVADESVEIGSGNEISPQLEGIEDTARLLEVDPVNSAKEAEKE